jgi:hypothetical protein
MFWIVVIFDLVASILLAVSALPNTFAAHTLQQTYVGPDGDGKFDVPVDARIPAGRFDAVGIRSWTEKDPKSGGIQDARERPCENYPRKVSYLSSPTQRSRVREAGTGCLILPLPQIPASPRLSLTWSGEGKSSDRLVVGVATDNAPTRLNGERACPAADSTAQSKAPPCTPGEGKAVRVAVQVKGELRGLGPAKDEKSQARGDAAAVSRAAATRWERASRILCASADRRQVPPRLRGGAFCAQRRGLHQRHRLPIRRRDHPRAGTGVDRTSTAGGEAREVGRPEQAALDPSSGTSPGTGG